MKGGPCARRAGGFQDIVRAEVGKEGDEFVLRMEMAAPIPLNPPLPPPAAHEIWWTWAIDLDRTTALAGYPYAPGCTLPSEIQAHVGWDGRSFHGIVIDRRPLLNGGQAIIETVPFSVEGATLELRDPDLGEACQSAQGRTAHVLVNVGRWFPRPMLEAEMVRAGDGVRRPWITRRLPQADHSPRL